MEPIVPVRDNAEAWERLYRNMMQSGVRGNINEMALTTQTVDGIPSKVTDRSGNRVAPKDAGNVESPAEIKPQIPDVYKDTNNIGTQSHVMGKPRRRYTAKKGKGKRKSSNKNKPRRGNINKRYQKKKTSRARITKK